MYHSLPLFATIIEERSTFYPCTGDNHSLDLVPTKKKTSILHTMLTMVSGTNRSFALTWGFNCAHDMTSPAIEYGLCTCLCPSIRGIETVGWVCEGGLGQRNEDDELAKFSVSVKGRSITSGLDESPGVPESSFDI